MIHSRDSDEPLMRLGARLAELLDEDQWAECEALLLAVGASLEELKSREREKRRAWAKDAARYRYLRQKFCIIPGSEGHAEFCTINLPRPTYIAPAPHMELDAAIDAEIAQKATRPPTPTGWSDTDWIKHLQEQEPHPMGCLHINRGSMDAAADAYEAEYNAERMLEALKAAAQFVETEHFPIGWSVDRIREVIAKVSS